MWGNTTSCVKSFLISIKSLKARNYEFLNFLSFDILQHVMPTQKVYDWIKVITNEAYSLGETDSIIPRKRIIESRCFFSEKSGFDSVLPELICDFVA